MLGIVVGCSTVTKLGDVYGRKPVYLSGMVMNFLLIGGSLFLKNMLLAWVCLFLLGVSVTARYYVGYTYNLEMQPKRAQVFVSTAQFTAESIVYLLVIAYFAFISSKWRYLQIPNLLLSLVGVVFIALMPESPRYLVASK